LSWPVREASRCDYATLWLSGAKEMSFSLHPRTTITTLLSLTRAHTHDRAIVKTPFAHILYGRFSNSLRHGPENETGDVIGLAREADEVIHALH
jgi:hypothetical protein